jgi:tetratricopeptide (TPR) repeat protein
MGAAAALVAGEFEEGRMEAILQRGLDHLRRGELYAAQGDYIQYLEARPGDPDAHAGLARTLVVTRDTGGARVHYRTACELLLEAKRRGDCENVFQEALRGIEDFSLGPDHQLGLAFGLERNLKPELAVRAYELFAGRYPDHAESAFALLRAAGIHLHTFSDPRAAMSLYERLVRDYPDDAWADFAREQRRKLLCQIG